ncbi:DUF5312 family protein [Treponema zioleckii]|uniref:DUF5312 family protein n=1 Tax=Treponema zioleckii TaxID=331680 RepID=UPI00168B6AEE|nr:DUF5312 family protein [Treponema zioleckii]
MGIFQALTEIFESIFMSSSPDVRKRQEIRKLENDLKNYQPQIYKSGVLLANFAELFRLLYENAKPISEILSKTIGSGDLHLTGKYEYQLIITGFTPELQERIEKLNYENRKQAVIDSDLPLNKVIEAQRKELDKVLQNLNAAEFKKIDDSIAHLHRFVDICNFNYINVIHAFDSNFDGLSSKAIGPVKEIGPDIICTYLQDLYYLTSGLELTSADARAVLALYQLQLGQNPSDIDKNRILGNIKKISMILTKILTPDILLKLICLGKNDPTFKPQMASYSVNSITKFIDFVKGRFTSDESRIKGEIKDYTISFELKELFGDIPLEPLASYNAETNDLLRQNSPYSFIWITAIQVIKTFLKVYFTEQIQVLLNNIVIEGFFNNSSYKSEFSQSVYTCCEIPHRLAEFEKSFERNGENDIANIVGLVEDSRKNTDFLKLLGTQVDTINGKAHSLVQSESKNFYDLYVQVGELIVDAKKSKSEMISNIKVLMSSTRNRDGSGILEQQYEQWKTFLKIMKNYAIIGDIEKNHD